jgi:ubiquinone/menaquinone biosynthesis C-methylase UbiE
MDRLLEATYRVEQRHFWWTGLRRFARPLVADALAGRSHPRILDCGCGTGANLVMLGEFGRATGFDVSAAGLSFARKYGQRRLAHASVTHVPFAGASFDLVTAFDVLYSLSEDDEAVALAEIYRVLKPGCSLIVNVAALDVLRGNHALFGAEVRRSTRRRLRTVLTRAGFEVTRLTYSNASIFPLILAVRTGQRVMGLASPEEAGTDVVLPPAPINAVLSGLLRLEARALRVMDMPIGSSLLCVARKTR